MNLSQNFILLTLHSFSSSRLVWFTADEQRYLLTPPTFSKQLCAFILPSFFLHNRQAERLVQREAVARLASQFSISNEVPISQELKYVEPKLPGLKFPVYLSCPSWTAVHSLNSWVCGRRKSVWRSYLLSLLSCSRRTGNVWRPALASGTEKASWWLQFYRVCNFCSIFACKFL